MDYGKKYRWVKIADDMNQIGFSENNLIEINIEGKRICLVKTDEGLKACAASCPHAGGNMSHGKLDAKGNIVCCVHNYRFSLSNGRDTMGEGYFLKIYPVMQNEEGVFLGMPAF